MLLNKRISLKLLSSAVMMAGLSGCATVPVNKKPIPVIPEADQAQRTKVPEGRGAVEFYPVDEAMKNDDSRISDVVVAYPALPIERLTPLFELGDDFLGNGPIEPGIETPTGQMLQPGFLLYGSLRTALQTFDNGFGSRTEQSNRIDLHGNLHLSGTERVVISFRPLDRESGQYTGYDFDHSNDDWHDEFNGKVTRLFFEGEFGEIFPRLDPTDSGTLDWGFSVGRQPITLQDGILLNDTVDLFGVTRNSLIGDSIPNLRFTGIFGWNQVSRSNTFRDDTARLYGLLVEADTGWDSTMSLDMIYVDDNIDTGAWYIGSGSTQRIGTLNSTFRVNASIPKDNESLAVDSGVILSAELSQTLHNSDNLVYLNTYWSIDHFTPAARSMDAGLPIANLGLLYSPVGMGRYAVPLGQSIIDTFGTSLGYQMYLGGIRKQLIVEIGARTSTESDADEDAYGIALRYQQAFGQRYLLRLDAFAADGQNRDTAHGARVELMVKF